MLFHLRSLPDRELARETEGKMSALLLRESDWAANKPWSKRTDIRFEDGALKIYGFVESNKGIVVIEKGGEIRIMEAVG